MVLANMWFQTLIRQFFFNIDKIVFNFIPMIYDFLIDLARTSILSQADILDMADRIYKLLAIFMIFKVTFSLIMYVVNPDDFSDKTKGISKLSTNIIISLALLILTPYIFKYAYELQTNILKENALATLVFGDSNDEEAKESKEEKSTLFNSAGEEMAYIIMTPFFTPNSAISNLYDCAQVTVKSGDNAVFNPKCSGLDSETMDTISNTEGTLYDLTDDNDKFTEGMLKNYVAGVNSRNLGMTFRQDLAVATVEDSTTEEEVYIMEYKYIISTVVGVLTALILVTFCMDVALRSIKLAFLQLIAPIPIISYVDPKSGKDGLFKKWYTMCFKTFASLFVRLLALYFAVYIISRIGKLTDIIDGSYKSAVLLQVFVVIGALMFAKQLPKILEDLSGIKLDGGFTLNPLKKMSKDNMLGGGLFNKAAKKLGTGAGRVFKGAGTAALVGGSALATGRGLRGMGKAFGGALKGEKFGKNFSNSYKAALDRKKEIADMKANGVKPSEVRREKFLNKFRGASTAEKVKEMQEKGKSIQSKYDTMKNQAVACDKDDSTAITREIKDANGNVIGTRTIKSAKTISKELDEMKKTQIDRNSFHDIEGKTAAQQYDAAVNTANATIQNLQAKKAEYQEKNSKINIDLAEAKRAKNNLKRDDFSSDNDFYEANAAYQQRIAYLEQEQQNYDTAAIDQQIQAKEQERDSLDVSQFSDIEGKTADEQYNEAIQYQKDAIKEKEADLEYRINALANGMSTGVESADKVISESKAELVELAKQVNQLGNDLDPEYKPMSENSQDIVQMMKTAKGSVEQTSSGVMEHISDVAKYAEKKN